MPHGIGIQTMSYASEIVTAFFLEANLLREIGEIVDDTGLQMNVID